MLTSAAIVFLIVMMTLFRMSSSEGYLGFGAGGGGVVLPFSISKKKQLSF